MLEESVNGDESEWQSETDEKGSVAEIFPRFILPLG